MVRNKGGYIELNADADPRGLRYWIGYPTEAPLDDLACQRVEEIVNDRIANVSGFTAYAVEARPEYVLAAVEGVGVRAPPQEVTDALGGLLVAYNQRYPDRPNNDAVELKIHHRDVGTLGTEGTEDDLDVARELLREQGASDPGEVTADADDTADSVEESEHA